MPDTSPPAGQRCAAQARRRPASLFGSTQMAGKRTWHMHLVYLGVGGHSLTSCPRPDIYTTASMCRRDPLSISAVGQCICGGGNAPVGADMPVYLLAAGGGRGEPPGVFWCPRSDTQNPPGECNLLGHMGWVAVVVPAGVHKSPPPLCWYSWLSPLDRHIPVDAYVISAGDIR